MGGHSLIPTLARRFLLSKVSDRFLSMIAWVSVVGMALGVLALTVVTSVINGFENELVRVITGMNGDVVLYSRGDPVLDAGAVEQRLRKVLPEIEAVTSSFVTELMASGPDGVAGAIYEGVDDATLGAVTIVPQRIIKGRMATADGEVVVGSSLAERIGVDVGKELRLVAPFVGDEEAGAGAPRSDRAKVVGIVKMGMYEYDSKFLFAPLTAVQRFMEQPGRVTSFKIKLKNGVDARMAADKLSQNFGYPFRAKDWGQLNKNLLYAIKLEKVVIAIILTVIVIVAAFNVVSTLMMMIHDKTREMAILKAMGFRAGQGFRLFCFIGMGIGFVGVLLGVGVGLGINWILGKTQLIQLPADIYYIGFLPVIVCWREIILIGVVALLVTFAATLYPSYKVSTRSPLEGLRYE
jgi:lipoprotein-releasing system permease protein